MKGMENAIPVVVEYFIIPTSPAGLFYTYPTYQAWSCWVLLCSPIYKGTLMSVQEKLSQWVLVDYDEIKLLQSGWKF